jgi:AcrR family transcriptional regulator
MPSTRDRLLDSAARVIAREGYHRARLVDVARDAGLTTGAVYSNFRDKEELFLAAFDRIQGLNETMFEESPRDVDAIIDSYHRSAVRFEKSNDLQVLNFELALLGARDPGVHDHLERGMRETIAAVADCLPSKRGRTDADRVAAAALMVGLGNGLALVRMLAPDLVPLELVESSLRRIAADGL